MLFDWVNEPEARENAFNPEPIAWDEHKEWFEGQLNDSGSKIYIAEAGDQTVGQIRFEREKGVAVVSVSVDSNFRGEGFGSKIIHRGSERYRRQADAEPIIEARIKEDNTASVKAFRKAGYEFHREDQFHGTPAVVYRYSASSQH